jgi:hypothetical protein
MILHSHGCENIEPLLFNHPESTKEALVADDGKTSDSYAEEYGDMEWYLKKCEPQESTESPIEWK